MTVVSGNAEPTTEGKASTLAGYIWDLVRANPDGTFIDVDTHGHITSRTYAAQFDRALAIAGHLRDRSIGDQPVVLCYATLSEYIPAAWACLLVGCAFHPSTPALLYRDKVAFWEMFGGSMAALGADTVLSDAETSQALREIATEQVSTFQITDTSVWAADIGGAQHISNDGLSPTDVYIQTSGSTGTPKLACISNDALVHRFYDGVGPDDRVMLNVLASHSIGGMRLLLPLGRANIFLEPSRLMALPQSWCDLVDRFQVTDIGLTNSNVANLVAHLENGAVCNSASIKRLAFGAEPIKPATTERFFRTLQRGGMQGARVSFVYSMTETGPLFMSSAPIDDLQSADWVTPDGYEFSRCSNAWSVRIRKEDGSLAQNGEPGTIEAYSKTRLFSGYNLDRTGLRNDGWFSTGDRAAFNGRALRLIGRDKNTIIVHGRKTTCEEIEMRLALVRELNGTQAIATAFQWPSDDTDRLALFIDDRILTVDGAEAVLTAINATVSRRFGLSVDAIYPLSGKDTPRTSTGKIHRPSLVSRIVSGDVQAHNVTKKGDVPVPVQWPTGVDGEIARAWVSALKLDTFPNEDDDFYASKGDSLALAELFLGVEGRFGVEIAPAEFLSNPTFGNFSNLVLSEFKGKGGGGYLEGPIPAPKVVSKHEALSKQWSHKTATAGPLIFARNVKGKNPPIFWVFQEESEFKALAKALGRKQPLFGMRSLVGIVPVATYENHYRQIGDRLCVEMQELVGDSPYILGGNCQAAIIALDVARKMTRGQRPPDTLVLMEWSYSFGRYDQKTMLLYGAQSHCAEWYAGSLSKQFWRSDFERFEVHTLNAAHNEFFSRSNVKSLAKHLLTQTKKLASR